MRFKIKIKLDYLIAFLLCTSHGFCYDGEADAIKMAETLYAEGNYQDAIPLYHQIMHASSAPCAELVFRLSNCYLEIKHPQAALDLLQSSPLAPKWQEEKMYLIGYASRQLNAHQKALDLLQTLSVKPQFRLNNKIALEKGINYFFLNKFSEAANSFKSINWEPDDPQIYFTARLYLIRIALIRHQFEQADVLLKNFEIPLTHPLSYEKDYLAGLCCFAQNNYLQAVQHLEKAAPPHIDNYPWRISTLRFLASGCLNMANRSKTHHEEWLTKAKSALDPLLAQSTQETDYFLLGDFYLLHSKYMQDEESAKKALEIFSQKNFFLSDEAIRLAALKYAEALPNYDERSTYFIKLQEENPQNLGQIYFWQGLNDLKEGLSDYQNQSRMAPNHAFFELAQANFEKAYFQLPASQAEQAIKYSLLAALFDPSPKKIHAAVNFLQNLIDQHSFWQKGSGEIYYLAGLIWKQMAIIDPSSYLIAEQALLKTNASPLPEKWLQYNRQTLGLVYFQHKDWQKAEDTFDLILEAQPDCHEVLFWKALCAEKQGDTDRKQNLLQTIYLQNTHSSIAPLAYFYTHTYREYLKGNKKAIKHLQAMRAQFEDHPLLISASYLIGMDLIKDHLTDEGTILRRKDFLAAIDAFHQAEMQFEDLTAKKKISASAMPYFLHIRYRSMLERALANLAVAKQSYGAKQQIYLQYAEGVFISLKDELLHPSYALNESVQLPLLEESLYWLAKTYERKMQMAEACQILDEALAYYDEHDIKKGYLLSRIWYEKGSISQTSHEYDRAIVFFDEAEKTALNLSPDQKLDLWIQQSLCYKEMGDLEQAMKILSKAVNDEAISSLRVKAMYLRADVYALQGRPELALKQLEAVSKKGGDWGKLAKEKLEKIYGY